MSYRKSRRIRKGPSRRAMQGMTAGRGEPITAVEQRIEYPARGATYCHQQYGVYEYGTYPDSSVLAGQERRKFLGTFDTLEAAQREYPAAQVTEGCGYRAPSLGHLSDTEG